MTIGDMKKATKKTKEYPRICFRVTKELLDQIDAEAQAKHMSVSQVVTLAVRRYLPHLKNISL